VLPKFLFSSPMGEWGYNPSGRGGLSVLWANKRHLQDLLYRLISIPALKTALLRSSTGMSEVSSNIPTMFGPSSQKQRKGLDPLHKISEYLNASRSSETFHQHLYHPSKLTSLCLSVVCLLLGGQSWETKGIYLILSKKHHEP
jgi:hypothetical protein